MACLLVVAAAFAGSLTSAGAAEFDSTAAAAIERVDAQPTSDPWGFPDEEDTPTWGHAFLTQGVELASFAAFLGVALASFFRKSRWLKHVTLAAAVLYLGVMRSQLISVVNLFGLMTWSLPIVKYSLGWYFFAVATVLTTLLWGRFYCGRICAFGALTQLLDRVVPSRWRIEVPDRIARRAASLKYVLLAGTLIYYLATRDISIYRYVEPFWMFTWHGTAPMWIGLAVLLSATVFIRNLYCRFLCPVGAFLGLMSKLTVFRIKRWAECKTCKVCEKACEWGAIRGPEIVYSECVRCDDCERLYLDTQKCPHWIIIRRKGEVMARQSAAPASSAGL